MTFAQFIGSGSTGIIGVLNTVVIPVIFAFAFAAFVWGVVNYFFLHGDEEGKREEGRKFMFWGIIGMVVLFSVWGFVNIMLSTLGIAPSA
jgi:heme/copper-type cytochrome/quinol oxidase subunit 4